MHYKPTILVLLETENFRHHTFFSLEKPFTGQFDFNSLGTCRAKMKHRDLHDSTDLIGKSTLVVVLE